MAAHSSDGEKGFNTTAWTSADSSGGSVGRRAE
jgi:hypothetical protein